MSATPRTRTGHGSISISGSSTPANGTPQRRSTYELQLLIDEVFAQVSDASSKTCRCADLPKVLLAFEKRRDIVLLSDDEKASLEAFAESHPDLDVTSEHLVSLLSAMTAGDRVAPDSPTRQSDTALPQPPISDDDADEETDNGRRRTTSLSSNSSESSRGSNVITGRGSLDVPDREGLSFPRSQSAPDYLLASPPPTPQPFGHRRAHTTSDPKPPGIEILGATVRPGQSTPLSGNMAARQRSSPLEVQQQKEGFRRTRPAPPKSRRISHDYRQNSNEGRRSRQASEEFSPETATSPCEGILSPNFGLLDSMYEDGDGQYAEVRPRQASHRSFRESSPLFETTEVPLATPLFAPTSPSLETSAFHPMPTSPAKRFFPGHAPDDSLDEGMSSLHSRPVSTISLGGSETAMAETIQQLQQELARKTQDLEALKADGYSALMEKEALLEEARAELAAKRREEKELRSKEKLNLNQIATLEAQTASFRDDRDKQKNAYQSARKQYEEQCNESEKLRNAIRARDEELRVAEDNLQNSASDLAKVIRERDYLQKTVSSLESDLAEARSAVEGLEEQKTENLQLRETIDRLRLDLDELRAQARVIESGKSSSLSRSASGSDSLPASLSRNLGNELARRLRTGQADDGDETETEHDQRHSKGSSDSYEEEIITTRRRLKRPVKKALPPTIDEDGKPVHGETITLDVVDIGIQVEPRPVPTAVIAVQTETEPDVPAHVKRSALARDLQVDLDEVDRYIQEKAERARLAAIIPVPDSAPPPYRPMLIGWQKHFESVAPSFAAYVPPNAHAAMELLLHSSTNFLLYTLIVFLTGMLSGAIALPVRHHHHVTPYDSFAHWSRYNTLDLGQGANAGWRDSLSFWIERLVWKGVAISRRIPT